MASCNEIHDDVIIEILTRLPVKSVIRAKAVCKNWYTIIKNPSFVTNHLNHQSGRLFVIHFDDVISKRYVFSLFSDQTLVGTPPVHRDLLAVDFPPFLEVVASPYNGILCVFNESNCFALWNPASREFKSLSVMNRKLPPNVHSYRNTIGFGLDPITNDYKVVWIWDLVDCSKDIWYGPYQVGVYSLSTDSWRYIDDVALPYYSTILDSLSNTCINGVYHWVATNPDGDDHIVILSFDMGNEVFHETRDLPSSEFALLAPYYDNNYSLALIYPEFWRRGNYASVINIWVMMEKGCWTKQSSVQLTSEHLPLGFWNNGQLIIQIDDGNHVGLYDPETHEIKDLGKLMEPVVSIYRESLVPINGLLQQDQDHLSDVDQVLNFSKHC